MRDEQNRQGYAGGGIEQRLSLGASFSGAERNHLFLGQDDGGFTDLSGVSGLDHPADGRAFAALDFDRDGWLDFAVVNANAPRFQLFRNRIGDLRGDGRSPMVALRLIGGNKSASTDPAWSNRDGYGALVTIESKDRTIIREHRAGEGLAAQNSAVMIIGLDEPESPVRVSVRWPSGRISSAENVLPGTEVSLFERASGDPLVRRYPKGVDLPPSSGSWSQEGGAGVLPAGIAGNEPLRLYVTMTTWCEACRDDLDELAYLRSIFPEEQFGLYGVPIDPNDDAGALREWVSAYRPPYRMLIELDDTLRESVQALVLAALTVDALPASIVTDGEGRILLTQFGNPSVSQIRKLQASLH